MYGYTLSMVSKTILFINNSFRVYASLRLMSDAFSFTTTHQITKLHRQYASTNFSNVFCGIYKRKIFATTYSSAFP